VKARSAIALTAALVMSAACNAIDSLIAIPQSQPIATISMNAQAKGGGFVTTPGAFFYRAVDNTQTTFTTAGTPTDSCHFRQVNNSGLPFIIDTLPLAASPVSAGDFVTMQLSGRTDTLFAPGPQSVGYRMALSTTHAFTPGDLATFNIPGSSSGFPAASASVQTAEAFTMDQVKFAPSGQDLPLTWTPATSPGSVLNFTITYVIGPTTSQIFCQFVDNGHATVPAAFFSAFPNATVGNPISGVDAIRMRTSLVQLPGSGAVVNIVSVFEFPTPASP
jgi:hypothetical protein